MSYFFLCASEDGDDGTGDKGRAVFSQCKEVTIGGLTTKQVTVSSNTEIVGGVKKASNPALMVPCFQLKDAQKEGFMYKLGGSGLTPKNWRRRWFVLKDKRLYYYKTAFDVSALGIVDMVGYSVDQSVESKKKYVLKASRQGARTYFFQAETSEDMLSWMECIKEAAVPDDQHDLMGSPQTIEASDDEL